MKWIIIAVSVGLNWNGDPYGKDWTWQQNPKQIWYHTRSDCDFARHFERELFQRANPERVLLGDFCMPLDRWLDELPVVGDPRTDENRKMRD